jgi:hypothetical protein
MTKSFETWEYEEVESYFNLKRVFELPELTNWQNSQNNDLGEPTKNFLKGIQKRLIINADAWNEDNFSLLLY